MSPDRGVTFEAQWPDVAHQLDLILTRRGVDAHTREDIVQETALRVFQVWGDIDHTRSVIPFAATIALNLMRDGLRKKKPELSSYLELGREGDVEREGLARLELARVARAIRTLPIAHRDVLLASVSGAGGAAGAAGAARPIGAAASSRSAGATKMLRMRARRRLAAVLETTAVVACGFRLKVWRAFNDPGHAVAALGASAVLAAAIVVPPAEVGSVDARSPRPARGPGATSPAHGSVQGGGPGPRVVDATPAQGRAALPPRANPVPRVAAGAAASLGRAEENGSGVEAGLFSDPAGGNSDVVVDAGFVTAKARQVDGEDYRICVQVDVNPVDSEACGVLDG